MKAWAITEYGPSSNLKLVDLPKPVPRDRDLLVKVVAVATNPIDYKKRSNWGNLDPTGKPTGPAIQGWDGAGVVEAVGSKVQKFKVGDEVFFAGDISRQGCHAEYVAIDERIVGKKPSSLSFEDAAAFPLTSLTVWEGLTDGFGLDPKNPVTAEGKSVLFIGGAGGVGSIGIQLAKKVFKIPTVIATASRPETIEYCKKMGADHVINHTNIKAQLEALGINGVNFVYDCVDANTHWQEVVDVTLPLGKIVVITGLNDLDVLALWFKRITLFPEIMFSRPLYLGDSDDYTQNEILNEVSKFLDAGVLQTTKGSTFEWSKLPEAHDSQESGKCIGKQVALVQ
eukprot:TRINITY_DN10408_c0_g1_i1.p1 TRINITY_DN10408_c0_g1~~TRINITY_DN10408_c0_g1_i1.p1  ORF type:complete len:352 (-),score=81.61 TRINITY_DN10408_c0_g1_i1:50-1069(-)